MSEKRTAAFFDFDKTLLAKESAELGFKYIWKLRQVSLSYLIKIYLCARMYKWNLLSADIIASMSLKYYKGRRLQDFIDGAQEFYDEWMKPHLSPSILEKVEEHRSKGHVLVLLSAGIDYYLEKAAEDLDFDHLLCSKLEVDENGICTGKTNGSLLLGGNKMIAASAFALRENIDLESSHAYSDHHSDIPLLEYVGYPVAVRPTRPLRKTAIRRGWSIIDEP